MRTVRVTTAPEHLELPENWAGCVTRDGATFPDIVPASEWRPGDVVQCMVRVNGVLQGVKFTVGSVDAVHASDPGGG